MKTKFNTKKLLLMIGGDLLLIAVLLLTFSYFHHVRRPEVTVTELPRHTAAPTEQAVETPAPADTGDASTPAAEASPAPTAEPTGLLKGKFADKFVSGAPVSDADSYRSTDIAIELRTEEMYDSIVHIADIYLNDIECFRTGVFDEYGTRYMSTEDMSAAAGALLAVSGDHFYAHLQSGVFVVRNGKLYAEEPNNKQDAYVLYYDGTMEALHPDEIDKEAIYAKEPYQIWYFGPSLLNADGTAMDKFASTVSDVNPRSSIGYYEPGHYCFVMVEGRSKKSIGVTLAQLSEIYAELGCTSAYNLDGGKTAVMTFGGEVRSKIIGSGRVVSDILYIREKSAGAAAQ